MFIAERCPSLQIDAYRLAIKETQAHTLDTKRYHQLITKLNAALESRAQPLEEVDSQWVELTQRKAKKRFDELEADLKGYRSNLIKESIRVGWLLAARYMVAYAVIDWPT